MIDVNKAKQKILDLAIRGKLTKQLKSDGNAADLLVEIQNEKEKLIKQGKIKRDKKETYIYKDKKDNLYYEKFITTETDILNKNVGAKQSEPEEKCIQDELPFEIPDNWVWCRAKEIIEIKMGQSPRGVNINNQKGMEFHQGKIFFGDKFLKESNIYTKEIIKIAEANSILLCVRAPVGELNITKRDVCIGRGLCALKPYYSMSNNYVYYVFSLLKKYFNDNSTGATFNAISNDVILGTLIPLPPLAEQKRIVEKVEQLFDILDKIDEAQKKYQKDKEILKSKIIEAGIRGKLTKQLKSDGNAKDLLDEIRKEKEKLIKEGKIKRDKKETYIYKKTSDNLYYEKYQDGTEKCIQDELPFEIPSNWVWCRASQLLYLIAGTSYNKADIKSDGIRILRGGNIVANQLVLFEDDVFVSASYQDEVKNVCKGDIILVASTGSKITIGKPARILVNHHKTQIGAFLRIARMYKNSISNYIWYIFNSSYYKNHILENVKGTNISNIKNEYIEDMLIPFPPFVEQEKIVKQIEELLDSLDS